ncbi:MAG TPA: Uma2 family endonuclease [Burkholderiales bacterium]
MTTAQEIIEAPLSAEELAMRYRDLCEDPRLVNVPGKIELDVWGRLVMTPASTCHGRLQGRICQKLAVLGGEALIEPGIATPTGLFVPDVAWANAAFIAAHGGETPLTRAPELCIEVVSPSSSVKELRDKTAAYLAGGAEEAWIVYPRSERCELFGKDGLLERSRYPVDLAGLFDTPVQP